MEGARRDVRRKSETNEERTCVNAGYRLPGTRSGRAHPFFEPLQLEEFHGNMGVPPVIFRRRTGVPPVPGHRSRAGRPCHNVLAPPEPEFEADERGILPG